LSEYSGEIYLVNAKYDRLGERRCYPSVASLPVVPDCVAVTVPREAVEEIVLEAARIGAPAASFYMHQATLKLNCRNAFCCNSV